VCAVCDGQETDTAVNCDMAVLERLGLRNASARETRALPGSVPPLHMAVSPDPCEIRETLGRRVFLQRWNKTHSQGILAFRTISLRTRLSGDRVGVCRRSSASHILSMDFRRSTLAASARTHALSKPQTEETIVCLRAGRRACIVQRSPYFGELGKHQKPVAAGAEDFGVPRVRRVGLSNPLAERERSACFFSLCWRA